MAYPPIGLGGSEQALLTGQNKGLSAIADATKFGINKFQPYSQGGANAFNLQAAHAGAYGKDAAQLAMDEYLASPHQSAYNQRGADTILANQAAIGGLGGGDVRKELTDYGIVTAAQDYGNYLNRLSGLGQMGYNAAGAQAGIAGSAAGAGANIMSNTYNNIASGRTRAAEMIGGNIANTTSALSNLRNQAGMNTAAGIERASGNVGNVVNQGYQDQAASIGGRTNMLAKIAMDNAQLYAGAKGLNQPVYNQGTMENQGRLLQGISAGAGALKDWWDNRNSSNSSKGIVGGGTGMY